MQLFSPTRSEMVVTMAASQGEVFMGTQVDAAIIGAGVSGLAAAVKLQRAGWRVSIIEARDRIGGRIHTMLDPLSPIPIELGAEFIHGRPPQLISLIDNFGLGAIEAGGEVKCLEDSRVVPCDDAPERLSEILDGFTSDDDVPFATLLAKTGTDESGRERVKSYVEGFNAANAGIVSSVALKRQQQAEDAIQGETMFRVRGGYSGIPQRLYSTLDRPSNTVRLNSTVTAVKWRNGGASVEMVNTVGGWKSVIECRHVLVTVPAGVLQSGAIRFNPEPVDLHEAMARLAVGEVARVTLRFRRRFWEDNSQFGSLGFLFATGEEFPTWWTQNPVWAPVLTAWAGGPKAEVLLAGGCVVEKAVECCARVFGTQMTVVRDELITSYFHDWHTDPFARGAYTYLRSSALGAVERLAQPFGDALYFAGEATDTTGHWGTVHGALASGERAADQILRSG